MMRFRTGQTKRLHSNCVPQLVRSFSIKSFLDMVSFLGIRIGHKRVALMFSSIDAYSRNFETD